MDQEIFEGRVAHEIVRKAGPRLQLQHMAQVGITQVGVDQEGRVVNLHGEAHCEVEGDRGLAGALVGARHGESLPRVLSYLHQHLRSQEPKCVGRRVIAHRDHAMAFEHAGRDLDTPGARVGDAVVACSPGARLQELILAPGRTGLALASPRPMRAPSDGNLLHVRLQDRDPADYGIEQRGQRLREEMEPEEEDDPKHRAKPNEHQRSPSLAQLLPARFDVGYGGQGSDQGHTCQLQRPFHRRVERLTKKARPVRRPATRRGRSEQWRGGWGSNGFSGRIAGSPRLKRSALLSFSSSTAPSACICLALISR